MNEKRIQYKAFFRVDTEHSSPLSGRYNIGGYLLMPCLNSQRNSELGCSSFILGFNFEGVSEVSGTREDGSRFFENISIASLKAKTILAWMVTATRQYARLSNISFRGHMTAGPFYHILSKDFTEESLNALDPDSNAKQGEFTFVKRPALEMSGAIIKPLKLPSDFPSLTEKLLSMTSKKRQQFQDACFAYQFALENWSAYPTVSIVALVSTVESMMVDVPLDDFCKDADKRCELKKNIVMRFRLFFEQNLPNLPDSHRKFLDDVYTRRSLFLHRTLLGETQGIAGAYGQVTYNDLEENVNGAKELQMLESLVNAGLIEWLAKA